jgi:protein gp37
MKEHKIGWLNIPGYKPETWNPVVGCDKISEGCDNCWAERMANRLAHNPKMGEKYTGVITNGCWNGTTSLDEKTILKPLEWVKPRAIAVCLEGDLFHPSVLNEWIDKVMIIAALRPYHIFIFLTKRPERMAEYFAVGKDALLQRWSDIIYNMDETFCITDEDGDPAGPDCYIYNRAEGCVMPEHNGWPFNNIWLGVTAENQQRANERIPVLLSIPAAKHIVSIEPMLGGINLTEMDILQSDAPLLRYDSLRGYAHFDWCRYDENSDGKKLLNGKLDWVIVGGETGPGAREIDIEWVNSIELQCSRAEVPFFMKSFGSKQKDLDIVITPEYQQFPKL